MISGKKGLQEKMPQFSQDFDVIFKKRSSVFHMGRRLGPLKPTGPLIGPLTPMGPLKSMGPGAIVLLAPFSEVLGVTQW